MKPKKTFEVLLSKTLSAKVQIKAESAEQAEELALDQFLDCEIELSDSGIPGDVDVTVTEIETSFDMISIYWNDLTPAKQAEILEAFGDNRNFDVVPIAELPLF